MNFNTSLLKTKTTTNTQGVQAFTAKKGRSVTTVGTTEEILGAGVSAEKFTAQSLPSAGALMKENDMPSCLTRYHGNEIVRYFAKRRGPERNGIAPGTRRFSSQLFFNADKLISAYFSA